MISRCSTLSLAFILSIVLIGQIAASESRVPAFLEPYAQWLEIQHPQWGCTQFFAKGKVRSQCVWTGEARFDVGSTRGNFTGWVDMEIPGSVSLPGDDRHWPLSVKVKTDELSEKILTPVYRDAKGKPRIMLEAGQFQIFAEYQWTRLPKSLDFPSTWALVDFGLADGIEWQRSTGKVSFRRQSTHQEQNAAKIQLYRHLQEGRPQIVTTQIVLTVTGVPRTLRIPKFQVPHSKQMSLQSALPTTTMEGGSLLVQVRPGRHVLTHVARLSQKTSFTAVNAPAVQKDQAAEQSRLLWPATEYWSFLPSDSGLRVADGRLVDATQVNVPDHWAHLPTYALTSSQGLQLEEKLNQKPLSRTQLQMEKNIWLGFEGRHWISVDQISGTMRDRWRMNLAPEGSLERASNHEKALLVTQVPKDDSILEGVELRSPAVSMLAVSRWSRDDLRVVGWDHVMDTVRGTLHLPPGWSLLATLGDRGESDDWLNQWTLWSLFLVLLLMTFAWKILGGLGLGLSTATALLTYQTQPQLILILLCVLGLAMSFQQLQEQFPVIRAWIAGAALAVLFLFVVQLVPYTIESARLVMYPQLEKPQVGSHSSARKEQGVGELDSVTLMKSSSYRGASSAQADQEAVALPLPVELGEKEFLQTGQAMPQWRWNTYSLGARAIVDPTEPLKLILLNPWQTSVWRLCSVVFLWLLFLRLAGFVPRLIASFSSLKPKGRALAQGVCLILGGVLFTGLTTKVQARTAPVEILLPSMVEDLERYLTRPPSCASHCIGISKGELRVKDNMLTWTLVVDAAVGSAFPLPNSKHWQPVSMTIDDQSAPTQIVSYKGGAYGKVPVGTSVVQVTGPIRGAELSFDLPLPIHHMSYDLDTWFSVNASLPTLARGRLQLERRQPSSLANESVESPGKLKKNNSFTSTYLEVTRHLRLGVRWTLTTRVERRAPAKGLIQAQIPLWPEEKPTRVLDVQDRMVQIEMSGQSVQWTSELNPLSALTLVSAAGDDYYERWIIEAGPRWQFSWSGVAPEVGEATGYIQRWRPLADDSLALTFTRPGAKEANSQSVEKGSLVYALGEAANQASLTLHLLAASPGDYQLTLDDGAQVQSIKLNDRALWSEGSTITVPLVAGSHRLEVEWKVPVQKAFGQEAPMVESSLPLHNLQMEIVPPRKTWILQVFGPSLGPAVLFWGVLTVIIGAAFGLRWLQGVCRDRAGMQMPMKLHDWLLLGVGLCSVWHYALIPIALWLFVISWRATLEPEKIFRPRQFAALQVVLIVFCVFLVLLVAALIPQSLLANPEMFILGNGSSSHRLRWFQDMTPGQMPRFGYFALPSWVFHGLMLVWSLWLARKAVQWLKFALRALQEGRAWKWSESRDLDTRELDKSNDKEKK